MSGDRLRAVIRHCAGKPGAIEDRPFGPIPAVYKVGGKMFALVMDDTQPGELTLKCDPELALELRAIYPSVVPGYHLDKRHWNTITLDGGVPDDELVELIDHSYDLVVAGLPRRLRDALGG